MANESSDVAVIGGEALSVAELKHRVDPSLLKPGAELLAMTFGISVDVEIQEELNEFEAKVIARAVAKDRRGNFLGSAAAACSTREKKYRWREPVHPKEFENYPGDLKRITYARGTGKEVQQVRQDPGEILNTLIQMASKRASVQVVRFICGASDVFVADPNDDRSEYDDDRPGPVTRTAAGEKAAGALRVVGFHSEDRTKKDTGEPYTMYAVTLSDGRKPGTIRDAVGKEAEQAFKVGFAVKVQVSPGRKEGELRLDSIERAEAA